MNCPRIAVIGAILALALGLFPATTARVATHLVAHLTRDAGPHGAGSGLGDQIADPVSSGHRKVLRG